MSQVTLKREDTALMPVWSMAMALSSKRWKVAFSNGVKRRHVTVAAGVYWNGGRRSAKRRSGLGSLRRCGR